MNETTVTVVDALHFVYLRPQVFNKVQQILRNGQSLGICEFEIHE